MQQALDLAAKGMLDVSPNPLVGCVIVKDNVIVGQGYHQRHGEAHAEILALQAAGAKAKGATMYLTLEPCNHHGKTPPCAPAIVKAGIKEIHIATLDPNPLVNGQGVAYLLQQGLTIHIGSLEDEAKKLNAIFFHYMQTKRPYVIAKWAMSLDGKTVTGNEDRNITSPDTQQNAHLLRQQVDAILIGAETARADNPSLTVRHPDIAIHKHPLRIILSTKGDLPLSLKLFDQTLPGKTLLIVTEEPNAEMQLLWQQHSIQWLKITDLSSLLDHLGALQITSLLVEGGMTVLQQFFRENLINKVRVYIAPMILGDGSQKIHLEKPYFETSANDFCLQAQIGEQYV